jgi:hypothetical protein
VSVVVGAALAACGARGPGANPPAVAVVEVASARPVPSGSAPRPPLRKRYDVRRTGGDVYEVPEALFRRILRERGALDRRVWTEPVSEGGKITGYRLGGIRPESILDQLGLHDDDLVELINGALPDSPEALDGAEASAERTGRVTVLLTRLGTSRILQYQIAEE